MAGNASLAALITQEAQAQGVPPAIALAVAQQESGIQQWRGNNLVVGSAGEIGVFQLMPATADSLGVDPTNPNENISGGISFLAQLYRKYGNWPQALSAYNSGSPTGSPSYAASVLSIASSLGTSISNAVSAPFTASGISTSDLLAGVEPLANAGAWILGGLVIVGVALWVIAD